MRQNKSPNDGVVKAVKIGGILDCFTAYSNIAQVIATAFDIQIVFAEMVETDDEVVRAQPRARIVMSPEQAMLLVHTLSSRLNQFQEANGPLRQSALEALTTKRRSLPMEDVRDYSLWKDIRGFLAVSVSNKAPKPVAGYLVPSDNGWFIEGDKPPVKYDDVDEAASTLVDRFHGSPTPERV
jgi:hypothetical protein